VTPLPGIDTITFHPRKTVTVTDTITLTPYETTITETTPYIYTSTVYTTSTTVDTAATATRTECLYTADPVMNPSFNDGMDGWRRVHGDQGRLTTMNIDETVSHDEGGRSWKMEFNGVGTYLYAEQEITGLCPTTWYTVTAWIKPDAHLCQAGFRIASDIESVSPMQFGWNKYTVNGYTGPAGRSGITIMFGVECWNWVPETRTFWIDNLAAQKMDPQPPAPY
jgi:hypothetical protein